MDSARIRDQAGGRENEKTGRNRQDLQGSMRENIKKGSAKNWMPEYQKNPGVTEYGMESHILKFKNTITGNWKRGVWAAIIFITVWIMILFIAFMTALGNDTPLAGTILGGVELFATVANPVWGIPAAFLIGVYSKKR